MSDEASASPVARWLLAILWREHDWSAALERMSMTATRANRLTGARAHRTAIELAHAMEYIEPDRRRAIMVYELASDHERARELASELGWWSARARLSARIIDSPEHVLDEAEAWWDAGQPDLCALALAEVRGADRGVRGAELANLVAERDLAANANAAVARAAAATGTEAADAYVMAARFCRAAGLLDQSTEQVMKWLEAAVVADRKHAVAARFLLELARRGRDSAGIKRVLKLRLEGADMDTWLDGMRACALALIDSEHHRGFGQRLLRQTLERAYAVRHPRIPGHLAMWTVLAAHASAAGTRRELLPFAITALNASTIDVDRVWLGALATEISLREGNNPVVAGAYAEIVSEHAPQHPIVRELVSTVAEAVEDEPTSPIAIPVAAITAAKQDVYEDVEIEVDLESAYAEAADAPDDGAVAIVSTLSQPIPTVSKDDPAAPLALPAAHKSAAIARNAEANRTAPLPLPTVRPAFAVPKETSFPERTERTPARRVSASVAPASIAKPSAPAKQSSIIPASIANPKSMIPPASAKQSIAVGQLPAIPRVAPVLAALRTPDRPVMPPRPADPPNAKLRARRIAIPIDVRLVLADGTRVAGTSRDLSTTGLFVLTTAPCAIGDEVTLELLLPGTEAFTEDEYRVQARIARRTADGWGVELLAPEPDLVTALDQLG